MELVECTQDYWEFVRVLRTHSENKNWFFSQTEITPEQQQEYMSKNSDKYKICLIENRPVGYIGLINNNEITYCVDPDVKGKGIGTFMVSELMKLNDNLTAFVFPQNTASNRVFEKLGFSRQNYYIYRK